MKQIQGGVTAPQGFVAGGVHAGMRKNKTKRDLALICSAVVASAAGVFTRNLTKAAPVLLDMQRLADNGGRARAIVVNSGNANACAPNDMAHARRMAQVCADSLGIDESLVLVGSTGVIGQELNIAAIEGAMDMLIDTLAVGEEAAGYAAEGIMTTDTRKKELAVSYTQDGVEVRVGGIAKGSGMIHPNMGTMLAYVTTDATISPSLLQSVLRDVTDKTFNRITVDGDTSTNDTLIALANGMSGAAEITEGSEAYRKFYNALHSVLDHLAREVARDGEGATKLVTCTVCGAKDEETAVALAKSVIGSSLVKAAMFGSDANCGRVMCALGYAGADFEPSQADVSYRSNNGEILVCRQGVGLAFDEALARTVLDCDEVDILVSLGGSEGNAVTCYGCDLTYEYVKINGDYRT